MNPTPNVRRLRYDQTRRKTAVARFAGLPICRIQMSPLPLAIVLAAVVLGERLNWQHYVGGAFIVTVNCEVSLGLLRGAFAFSAASRVYSISPHPATGSTISSLRAHTSAST
jgi:hypothetical protein